MDDAKNPLANEAAHRSEWRGEDAPQPDGTRGSLPASEERDFDLAGDRSDGRNSRPASEEDDERLLGDIPNGEPVSHPGTIPPPD